MPLAPLAISLSLLFQAAAPSAADVRIEDGRCTVERIGADGRRTVEPPTGGSGSGGRSASASASSQGVSSSSSSVSASASSRDGQSSVRSEATSTDANGRTITTIHDGERCTIIVDGRVVPGASR